MNQNNRNGAWGGGYGGGGYQNPNSTWSGNSGGFGEGIGGRRQPMGYDGGHYLGGRGSGQLSNGYSYQPPLSRAVPIPTRFPRGYPAGRY